jgi:hypothetical protein
VTQPVPSYPEPGPARPADVHALVIGQALTGISAFR